MMSSRPARLLVGVVLACTLGGCSGGSMTPGMTDAGADAPDIEPGTGIGVEKNRGQWALPLDPYMLPTQYGHAVDVLVEPCMQEHGFAIDTPAVNLAQSSPTTTPSLRNIFDVATAGAWGYGGAPDPNAAAIRAASAQSMTWSTEQQEQYSACLAEAREVLPEDWARISNTVAGMAVAAWTGAVEAPEVVAAAEAWVQCMQPLGYTDLPTSPNSEDGGMPTPSMSATFGWVLDGMAESQTPEQEAEEIRIATFDAECRESSGYSEALYEAEWSRQLEVVEDDEDALASLLEEKNAYLARVDEVTRGAARG